MGKICATAAYISNSRAPFWANTRHSAHQETIEFAVQIILHLRWQPVSFKYYISNMVARRATKISLYHISKLRAKKGKDRDAEKFQSARRADDSKKLSARAEICRPRADVKGQH